MIPSTRRTKTVAFRLSLDEYQALETACRASGSRSLSDLARTAVQQWIQATSESIAPDLASVEQRLQTLGQEINRLKYLVQVQRAPMA